MKKTTTRFAQKHLYNIQKYISYKFSTLWVWGKICFAWIIICFISLFTPWLVQIQGSSVWSVNINIWNTYSFSYIVWNVGLFILLCIWVSLFSLFSQKNKQKISSLTNQNLKTETLLCVMALFIFFISLHALFSIKWLQVFSSNLVYGKWVILSLTWSLVFIFWAIKYKSDARKNILWVYATNREKNEQQSNGEESQEIKNNMKLPF